MCCSSCSTSTSSVVLLTVNTSIANSDWYHYVVLHDCVLVITQHTRCDVVVRWRTTFIEYSSYHHLFQHMLLSLVFDIPITITMSHDRHYQYLHDQLSSYLCLVWCSSIAVISIHRNMYDGKFTFLSSFANISFYYSYTIYYWLSYWLLWFDVIDNQYSWVHYPVLSVNRCFTDSVNQNVYYKYLIQSLSSSCSKVLIAMIEHDYCDWCSAYDMLALVIIRIITALCTRISYCSNHALPLLFERPLITMTECKHH